MKQTINTSGKLN